MQADYAIFNQGKALRWNSPIRTTDPIDDLMADQNAWNTGQPSWMFLAHQAGGPFGAPDADPDRNYYNWGSGGTGISPRDRGSVGGNVGRSDGSVAWKDIDDMYIYECSAPWRGFPATW